MRLALLGRDGRMGRAIVALAGDDAVLDFGKDGVEAVIDFSSPEGTAKAARWCLEHGVGLVSGTTGLTAEEQTAVDEAASAVPVVQSGNMSLGITLLTELVAKASQALDGFDIEILETHHRHKKDSPSGTALLLGEVAARARGSALSEAARFQRHGREEERRAGEIGFAVRRGGGVYGEHDVSFMSEGETISLSHTALSREAFARGALKAAHWTRGRQPGLYGMKDVLGLAPQR